MGKSNIIEAVVGFPSSIAYEFKLQDAVRFERPFNLFYDEIVEQNAKIDFKGRVLTVKISSNHESLKITVEPDGSIAYELQYYFKRSRGKEEWKWCYLDYYNQKR